ncbi:sentrin-specific protease 1-like, partial [Chiloscyllium plagiosum]|uniref:sentrin-specific protease 1-like n=1 Tax=Chiloscyllium plagiosum TaxID=36176 RepID=UPI001CB7C515
RLQEQENRGEPVVPQLHLRVALIEEIPIADLPPEEQAEDRPRGQHEEEEEHFPQLTEEMETAVRRAFQPGDLDDVLSEAFRLTITRKDIHTLNNLNWLNDE